MKEKYLTQEEKLKLCLYYKGEGKNARVPSEYDGKDEGKLWVAEMHFCECSSEKKEKKLALQDTAFLFIEAYVGKWDPYDWYKVMLTYVKKMPQLTDFIKQRYHIS